MGTLQEDEKGETSPLVRSPLVTEQQHRTWLLSAELNKAMQ